MPFCFFFLVDFSVFFSPSSAQLCLFCGEVLSSGSLRGSLFALSFCSVSLSSDPVFFSSFSSVAFFSSLDSGSVAFLFFLCCLLPLDLVRGSKLCLFVGVLLAW